MIIPNETIYQSFHWYYPADGNFWNKLAGQAEELKDLGVTMVWLPPAYKDSAGKDGVGYAVYDLYDLGEFDQHGTVRTKYGTKDEYIKCVETLHKAGIKIIVDIVLNHRLGGDEKEKVKIQAVNEENRLEMVGEPFEEEVESKFTFPGRKGKYSKFIWDYQCFTGIN
ncbi:MAG TPA: alpha-amylase family glycosyl hydrolase, partial [Cytophagales bacterium]|nr:alpha-amylase family glycosyl hydrolase [Cytophagales bacterium]